MSVKLHWFLPTSGDSRVAGRRRPGRPGEVPAGLRDGLGTATASASRHRLPRGRRPHRRAARLRGRAHADRHVLRGRLADHRGAAPRDADAEVPGRVPARRHQPDARRADGRGVPADLRRPADAQRGHRRRAHASRRGSATPRPRPSATPAPTSSSRSSAAPGRRRRSTSTASTSRSRAPWSAAASTRCRTSTSAGPRHRPVRSPPARRRLPDLGRAARAGRGEDRLDARPGRRAGPHAPVRAADPHALAGHQRGGLAARAVAARRPRPGDHREGAGRAGRERVRRAAADALAARRPLVVRRRARPGGRPEPVVGRRAWSAAGPARRWSAATRRSPTGSRSTTDLGIDEFILSGYPHVEEAYWFAEGVMPILRAKGIYGPGARERRLVSA